MTELLIPHTLAQQLKRTNPKLYQQIISHQTKRYIQSRKYIPSSILGFVQPVLRQNIVVENFPWHFFNSLNIDHACGVSSSWTRDLKTTMIRLFKIYQLLDPKLFPYLETRNDNIFFMDFYRNDPQIKQINDKKSSIKLQVRDEHLHPSTTYRIYGRYHGILTFFPTEDPYGLLFLRKQNGTFYVYTVVRYVQGKKKYDLDFPIDTCSEVKKFSSKIADIYKNINSSLTFNFPQQSRSDQLKSLTPFQISHR